MVRRARSVALTLELGAAAVGSVSQRQVRVFGFRVSCAAGRRSSSRPRTIARGSGSAAASSWQATPAAAGYGEPLSLEVLNDVFRRVDRHRRRRRQSDAACDYQVKSVRR